MIVPAWLEQGDWIGVTAPSDGNNEKLDFIRLDHAGEALGRLGYSVRETVNVRTSVQGRSCCAVERARQLMELLREDRIAWIVAAKGGDFLCEMLSCLDFYDLKKYPKWLQGYSDNTGLLFTVTTNCDIATIYGCNFKDFGMEPWHGALVNNVEIVKGNLLCQNSFASFENGFYDRVTGLESYLLTQPVNWKNGRGEEAITMKGRLLGGCLDVLLNLAGTRYDRTAAFAEEYREDGILWYLESFDLNSEELFRGLWQLREAGWFQHAAGFFFGRPCLYESAYGTLYGEAVLAALEQLSLPVILDGDLGHKAPQLTFINGAMGRIESRAGRGSLKLYF